MSLNGRRNNSRTMQVELRSLQNKGQVLIQDRLNNLKMILESDKK